MLPQAVSIARGSGVGARTSPRPMPASARPAVYRSACERARDQCHGHSGPTAAVHRARDAQSARHTYRNDRCAPQGRAVNLRAQVRRAGALGRG